MSVIKLDDDWDYLMTRPTSDTSITASFANIAFTTDDEIDSGTFSRSGSDITLATVGHYLVTYNIHTQNSSTSCVLTQKRFLH